MRCPIGGTAERVRIPTILIFGIRRIRGLRGGLKPTLPGRRSGGGWDFLAQERVGVLRYAEAARDALPYRRDG